MLGLGRKKRSASSPSGDAAAQQGAPENDLQPMGNEHAKSMLDKLKSPKETLYQARLDMQGRQQGVRGDAHAISNGDIVMEALAHQGAYGRLPLDKLEAWGYRQAGRVQDAESGFGAVLYVPTAEALTGTSEMASVIRAIHGGVPKPVLAFAGTDPKNKRDISDDTNRHGVGAYQMASNIGSIAGMMSEAGGKVITTGHSLGGALAQHAACRFPGNVARVVTFQAPGIQAEDTEKLKKFNDENPDQAIQSTHFRAEGDVVHAAGESLTEGDVFEFQSVGIGDPRDHSISPLARLSAARGGMIPGLGAGEKGVSDRLTKVKRSSTDKVKGDKKNRLAEWGRKKLGGIARHDDMEPYVALWKQVEELCESGAFAMGQVKGIIRDSDQITEVQKIKMRDNVDRLYGDKLV